MTTIRLHNTKTRKKEVFEPLDPRNVRMYVCGPTVYDRAHLGNARPVLVFDVLYRLLRHVYGAGHVTYVRNFTDVDDKINARAAATGRSIREITDETIGWYHEDMDALGALRPNHEPRATEYIGQMIAMIADLVAKGHAYEAEGHVLFAVESYKAYGALSGRSVDDMIAGARVEVAPYKRNPMDFVLWKPSTGDQPGWDSPWGFGRPGWHIECSAMADDLLWKQPLEQGRLSDHAKEHPHAFDIHGGGNDLQFPHHENEIAQSKCAHPEADFARYWLHNEMLQVEGKKMSKSLGNFFTVHDLLEQGVPGEVIRFVMLGTHYRKPMDWTEKKREEEQRVLESWFNLTKGVECGTPFPEVIEILADDLNTPGAINFLKSVRHEVVNGQRSTEDFLASVMFLGVELQAMDWPRDFAQEKMKAPDGAGYSALFDGVELVFIERPSGVNETEAKEISLWISLRTAARQKRLFNYADALKAGLEEAGVQLQESKQGVKWEPLPNFDIAKLPELPSLPPVIDGDAK